MDEFKSVDECLNERLNGLELKEVKRILYGNECPNILIPDEATALAEAEKFELAAYEVPSSCDVKRVTKVGLIQNKIVIATSEPVDKQRLALHERIKGMIHCAHLAGVNVVCLQV